MFVSKISKCQNLTFFTFFDLTLNLILFFYDKSRFNGIATLSFEFYVEIEP